MCREAFQEIHQQNGRNVELLENVEPGMNEAYRIRFTPGGKPMELKAFKCPTEPTLYLSVADQTESGQNVWIIIEDPDPLKIVEYQVKMAVNIVESKL